MILQLLEEVVEADRDITNRRSFRVERDRLQDLLDRMEAERRRLTAELETLEGHGTFRVEDVAAREESLATQSADLQKLLDEWKKERDAGRRRRLRDQLWLEMLLMESDRLMAEGRRLREQAQRLIS